MAADNEIQQLMDEAGYEATSLFGQLDEDHDVIVFKQKYILGCHANLATDLNYTYSSLDYTQKRNPGRDNILSGYFIRPEKL